eukprot:m.479059 g.479059  ORF g.479059 m.479059 type:complete len:381 (+) comp21311_c0_seq1:1923-3065(+)
MDSPTGGEGRSEPVMPTRCAVVKPVSPALSQRTGSGNGSGLTSSSRSSPPSSSSTPSPPAGTPTGSGGGRANTSPDFSVTTFGGGGSRDASALAFSPTLQRGHGRGSWSKHKPKVRQDQIVDPRTGKTPHTPREISSRSTKELSTSLPSQLHRRTGSWDAHNEPVTPPRPSAAASISPRSHHRHVQPEASQAPLSRHGFVHNATPNLRTHLTSEDVALYMSGLSRARSASSLVHGPTTTRVVFVPNARLSPRSDSPSRRLQKELDEASSELDTINGVSQNIDRLTGSTEDLFLDGRKPGDTKGILTLGTSPSESLQAPFSSPKQNRFYLPVMPPSSAKAVSVARLDAPLERMATPPEKSTASRWSETSASASAFARAAAQ